MTAFTFGRTWLAVVDVPHGTITVSLYLEQDMVSIHRWTDTVRGEKSYTVPNCGTSLAQLADRPGFAVGWGQFPDGCEVVYLYDREDDGFGYAINLDAPSCSEWGYAPFRDEAP